jgi:Gnt-I system high-affinity gluconate transporter
VEAKPLKEFMTTKVFSEEELPSFSNSILTALLPVILIAVSTLIVNFFPLDGLWLSIIKFIGNPVIALLLTVLVGTYTLGIARGLNMDGVMKIYGAAVSGITMVLLIIAGAGSLKQILIDSGVSEYIREPTSNYLHVALSDRLVNCYTDPFFSWFRNSCWIDDSWNRITSSPIYWCKSRIDGFVNRRR